MTEKLSTGEKLLTPEIKEKVKAKLIPQLKEVAALFNAALNGGTRIDVTTRSRQYQLKRLTNDKLLKGIINEAFYTDYIDEMVSRILNPESWRAARVRELTMELIGYIKSVKTQANFAAAESIRGEDRVSRLPDNSDAYVIDLESKLANDFLNDKSQALMETIMDFIDDAEKASLSRKLKDIVDAGKDLAKKEDLLDIVLTEEEMAAFADDNVDWDKPVNFDYISEIVFSRLTYFTLWAGQGIPLAKTPEDVDVSKEFFRVNVPKLQELRPLIRELVDKKLITLEQLWSFLQQNSGDKKYMKLAELVNAEFPDFQWPVVEEAPDSPRKSIRRDLFGSAVQLDLFPEAEAQNTKAEPQNPETDGERITDPGRPVAAPSAVIDPHAKTEELPAVVDVSTPIDANAPTMELPKFEDPDENDDISERITSVVVQAGGLIKPEEVKSLPPDEPIPEPQNSGRPAVLPSAPEPAPEPVSPRGLQQYHSSFPPVSMPSRRPEPVKSPEVLAYEIKHNCVLHVVPGEDPSSPDFITPFRGPALYLLKTGVTIPLCVDKITFGKHRANIVQMPDENGRYRTSDFMAEVTYNAEKGIFMVRDLCFGGYVGDMQFGSLAGIPESNPFPKARGESFTVGKYVVKIEEKDHVYSLEAWAKEVKKMIKELTDVIFDVDRTSIEHDIRAHQNILDLVDNFPDSESNSAESAKKREIVDEVIEKYREGALSLLKELVSWTQTSVKYDASLFPTLALMVQAKERGMMGKPGGKKDSLDSLTKNELVEQARWRVKNYAAIGCEVMDNEIPWKVRRHEETGQYPKEAKEYAAKEEMAEKGSIEVARFIESGFIDENYLKKYGGENFTKLVHDKLRLRKALNDIANGKIDFGTIKKLLRTAERITMGDVFSDEEIAIMDQDLEHVHEPKSPLIHYIKDIAAMLGHRYLHEVESLVKSGETATLKSDEQQVKVNFIEFTQETLGIPPSKLIGNIKRMDNADEAIKAVITKARNI